MKSVCAVDLSGGSNASVFGFARMTLRIDVPANAYVSCIQLRFQGVAQRQLKTVVIFAFVFTRLTSTHRGGP